MAAIKHARGVKLLLKVGDGATPEVFTAICTINAARGIKFSSTSNESPAIQCDNPEAIAWTLRDKTGMSAAIDGAGTLNTPDVQTMFDWLTDDTSRNCQVVVDVPSADGGVIFEGAFHLTDFDITGDRGGKMQSTLTFASDGEVTCVANT